MKKKLKLLFLFLLGVFIECFLLSFQNVNASVISESKNLTGSSSYLSNSLIYNYDSSNLMTRINNTITSSTNFKSFNFYLKYNYSQPSLSDLGAMYTNFVDIYDNNYSENDYISNVCNSLTGEDNCNSSFSFYLNPIYYCDTPYCGYTPPFGHENDTSFTLDWPTSDNNLHNLENIQFFISLIENVNYLYKDSYGFIHSVPTIIKTEDTRKIYVSYSSNTWQYSIIHDVSDNAVFGYNGLRFGGGVSDFTFNHFYAIRVILPLDKIVSFPTHDFYLAFSNTVAVNISDEAGVIPPIPNNEITPNTDGFLDNIERALYNDSVNDSKIASTFNTFKNNMPLNNDISSLFLIVPNFLSSLASNLSSNTCTPVDLGDFMGTHIIIPCIDLENILGVELYEIIDILLSGCAVLGFRKYILHMYQSWLFLNAPSPDGSVFNTTDWSDYR